MGNDQKPVLWWLNRPGYFDPRDGGEAPYTDFSDEPKPGFEPLYDAAALTAAEQRGREAAAKRLDARSAEIANEYGDYEPDTNATNLPEWADAVCEELEGLAAAIRKGD